MRDLPEIDELIKLFSKLPGLGPKSARRIVLTLINKKNELYKPMVNSMANVFKNILRCKSCGTLKSTKSNCLNCSNEINKINKICVVEDISDQWSIEASNIFKGYFHILGGTISNNSTDNSQKFLIDGLISQIKKHDIDEVILATSATIEGQTTAFFVKDMLSKLNIKVSKLAQGVPIGGEIENLDDGTLVSAFKNRKDMI